MKNTMGKKPPQIVDRNKLHTAVNCFSCMHFLITHDLKFPYGCKAVGFKSRFMPSAEMLTHSGIPCQLFREKG